MLKLQLFSSTNMALPLAIIVLLASGFSSLASAQSAEEKGLTIAKERKSRDRGWSDSVAESSLILRNPRGDETELKMRVKSLEMQNDGDKGLTIFDHPLDIRGSAFLSFTYPLKPDDQWLYLPKAKKVKRIQSKNKSSPFMGSEFAYEDMSSFEIEKFNFKYLRDENYQGQDCFVVEQVSLDKDTGYSRSVTWIDKQHYRAQKIEFYDRKNSLLKVLTMHNYQLYLDKYWRPLELRMENQQNGRSSDLITHSLQFKTGLSENDFDKDSLMRAR